MKPLYLDPHRFFGVRRSLAAGRGVRVTESRFEAGVSLPEHAHANPHFCLVLSGAYRERIGRRDADHGPRTLMYLPAGTPHAETHRQMGAHLILEFTEEGLRDAFDFDGGTLDRPAVLSDRHTLDLAWRIYHEFQIGDELSPLSVEGLTLDLVVTAARLREPGRKRRPLWLAQVEEHLRSRFRESPYLTTLAAQAGIHPTHLARVFRRFHGCSIGEYVRELRVARARDLLPNDKLSLAEIAQAVGFCDQSHFTRTFRRQAGVTPGEYRRRLR